MLRTLTVSFAIMTTAIGLCGGCSRAKTDPKSKHEQTTTASRNKTIQNRADFAVASIESIPETNAFKARSDNLTDGVNAVDTDWKSEAFVEAVTPSLKKLAKLLTTPDEITQQRLEPITSAHFVTTSLRPDDLIVAHAAEHVIVRRKPEKPGPDPAYFQGEAASESLKALGRVLQHLSDATVKLKIVDVEYGAEFAETKIFAEGRGLREKGSMQWTGRWSCRWEKSSIDSQDPPQLESIRLDSYEEVESRTQSATWFADCSRFLFSNIPSFEKQFNVGMDIWVNRLEKRLHVNRLGHHGIALGDVNGDGRDDIYVCHSGGLPNRLFLQTANGKMQDVSRQAGVDFLDDTACALLIDLDNDGDQDLVVATVAGGLALANDGDGKFEIRAHLADCQNAFSLTAADYDNDRLLDLYVGRYWPSEETRGEIPIPVPFFDANNGGRNTLYRNLGWRFQDVTQEVGLEQDNTRYTMAASWDDLDQDGDIDLYVANDFGRNCWYRNDNGRFSNQAVQAGLEDIATGMSVSYADYNHDGTTDLYVGNMFSSAGSRIAYQRQYADAFESEQLQKVRRLARGNTLFSNLGNGKFQDVSEEQQVTMGRWAWGSIFSDLDNDGWEDLVVLNGHISTEDSGDL